MPFTSVPIEFQHFWFRCVDAELAFTVHCALFRGFATMHSTGIGKLNVNFCMNPICSIAALFESGNYNTLPRIQPHIFFSFIASTAIASNITKSTSLPSYAYEFATACRYLFILFLLLVCRVPTKHIRIQNERNIQCTQSHMGKQRNECDHSLMWTCGLFAQLSSTQNASRGTLAYRK